MMGKTASVQNASVTDVKREKKTGTLQWTEIENALPFPLPLSATDPVTDLALEAGGIEAALDQEMLTVTGLAAGDYALTIDDQPVANFTADALQHGVNLARMATPMLRQSQTLAWETDHRNELERRLFTLGCRHGPRSGSCAGTGATGHARGRGSFHCAAAKGRAAGDASLRIEAGQVGSADD